MWLINLIKNLFKKRETIIPVNPGLFEDLEDYRDVLSSAVLGEGKVDLPEEYKLPFKLTITDQGRKPHCVGHTCATIKEFFEKKEGNNITFDPAWIYNECKKIDNYNGQGTYFRSGLEVLLKTGAKPTEKGSEEAEKYRIGGYAKLDDLSPEGLKRAIYEKGPILIGFRGSNEGWKGALIRPPKKGERVWGHAIALAVGWNKDYFIAQNSWGKDFGNNGCFYFDKSYMPFTGWLVLVDLPNNWKELLDKGDKPQHYFRTNLWMGMRGSEIVKLQNCLKWIGSFPKEQESTGYFGNITLQAVINFQKRYSIYPQVGFVGPISRNKLNEIFK